MSCTPWQSSPLFFFSVSSLWTILCMGVSVQSTHKGIYSDSSAQARSVFFWIHEFANSSCPNFSSCPSGSSSAQKGLHTIQLLQACYQWSQSSALPYAKMDAHLLGTASCSLRLHTSRYCTTITCTDQTLQCNAMPSRLKTHLPHWSSIWENLRPLTSSSWQVFLLVVSCLKVSCKFSSSMLWLEMMKEISQVSVSSFPPINLWWRIFFEPSKLVSSTIRWCTWACVEELAVEADCCGLGW